MPIKLSCTLFFLPRDFQLRHILKLNHEMLYKFERNHPCMRVLAMLVLGLLLTGCITTPGVANTTNESKQETVNTETQPQSGFYQCNGSSSPKDYYVRDAVNGTNDEDIVLTSGDNCVDYRFPDERVLQTRLQRGFSGEGLISLTGVDEGRYLREAYCNETGGIVHEDYRCPYGCKQGVCLQVNSEDATEYLQNVTMRQQDELTELRNQLELQKYENEKLRNDLQTTMVSKETFESSIRASQEYFWQNAHKFVECSEAGGLWETFPSGCADFCGAGPVCTGAITPSCDCGPSKCWNGTACI